MLARSLRCWSNLKPTLARHPCSLCFNDRDDYYDIVGIMKTSVSIMTLHVFAGDTVLDPHPIQRTGALKACVHVQTAVPTWSAAVPGSALRPGGSSGQIQTGVRAAGISVNQEAAGRGRAMDRQAVSAGWCERGQQAEDNRPARQCVLILQTSGYWRASTPCERWITVLLCTDEVSVILHPADTRLRINFGLMLVQRRRRWANVKPILFQFVVFFGKSGWTVQRRRRWNSSELTMGQRILFAGVITMSANTRRWAKAGLITLNQHWFNAPCLPIIS